jgi:ferrous iron transport protein A
MADVVLADIPLGDEAVVQDVRAARGLAVRLMELGLVTGTRVFVRRKAPLGDPLEIELRGYSLSIRRDEAQHVLVTRPETSP